jgi:hypothetical protein
LFMIAAINPIEAVGRYSPTKICLLDIEYLCCKPNFEQLPVPSLQIDAIYRYKPGDHNPTHGPLILVFFRFKPSIGWRHTPRET